MTTLLVLLLVLPLGLLLLLVLTGAAAALQLRRGRAGTGGGAQVGGGAQAPAGRSHQDQIRRLEPDTVESHFLDQMIHESCQSMSSSISSKRSAAPPPLLVLAAAAPSTSLATLLLVRFLSPLEIESRGMSSREDCRSSQQGSLCTALGGGAGRLAAAGA